MSRHRSCQRPPNHAGSIPPRSSPVIPWMQRVAARSGMPIRQAGYPPFACVCMGECHSLSILGYAMGLRNVGPIPGLKIRYLEPCSQAVGSAPGEHWFGMGRGVKICPCRAELETSFTPCARGTARDVGRCEKSASGGVSGTIHPPVLPLRGMSKVSESISHLKLTEAARHTATTMS